jgi:hypothetical protein
MPLNSIDYTHTIIYKFCCKDTTIKEIYVGHTTNFTRRKNQHKLLCYNENSAYYNKLLYQCIRDNGGWENWSMIQITEVSCNNKREAEAIEHEWIEKLSPSLNKNMPYAKCKEEPVEYKKNWYETNKDELLKKAKEMYDKNKDTKLEYQKEYAEQNKEKIKEYQDKYREENKEKLAADKKIYREKEENKEKAAIDSKEWREKNKDKIKEQNSTICVCECGNSYTHGNRIRHLQSKVHNDFFNPVVEEDAKELALAKAKELAKEKQKAYRLANAEKIRLSKQKYNQANKEKNKEQCKKYYQLNSDKIKQQNKEYQQEHKEQVKQYSKEWYEANKESILEKQQTTYTCECGSIIRLGGKQEHLKSAKHTTFSKGGAKPTNPLLEKVEPNQHIHT